MPTTRPDEIAEYLKHNDFSLAVRRMLDMSLESGDPEIMKDAIAWSRKFHDHEKDQSDQLLPDDFLSMAQSLISRIKQIEDTSTPAILLAEADGISKRYSTGNFTLNPISVKLHAGNILGVVGENGNGKTTLLRCMAGQLALDRGYIKYNLLQDFDFYKIRNHIAFIPQRIPRWYGQLKDNLHFSASIAGLKGAENMLMVDFMLERFNLSSYSHLNWNQISSGYRTRFEIARILLQRPRLLILDEPLANLDIKAQQTILTDLKYIAKSSHNPMGILLSSQQLHEVEKIADSVMFIRNGTCLYRTGDSTSVSKSFVLELETTASRDSLIGILGNDVTLEFNGGFYTITSTSNSVQDMVAKLVTGSVPITYFRDITYSTKRFFN
jgi:ABC-2 type transport system ATP-binding protein